MRLDWEKVAGDTGKGYRLLSYENYGRRFSYGLNGASNQCLVFYPESQKPAGNSDQVEKLEKIELLELQLSGRKVLVLQLLDETYLALFEDLIDNIASELSRTVGNDYLEFIKICHKWFRLFDPRRELNRAELQGIFAELVFLAALLSRYRDNKQAVLESWKGPFDAGHDFELNNAAYEIKGASSENDVVHISSEYQLDVEAGNELYLYVMIFEKEGISPYTGAKTLSDIINHIYDLLAISENITVKEFEKRLLRLSLSKDNAQDYDHHSFVLVNCAVFLASDPEFPSIRRSGMLPLELKNVRYDMRFKQIPEKFHYKDTLLTQV